MKGFLFFCAGKMIKAGWIFGILMLCLGQAGIAGAGMQPSSIIAMPGKGSTALVVEKSSQTLWVYRMEDQLVLDRKLDCSTGKMTGRKMEDGDQKTPEGVYFFVTKYVEKHLSPVYGVFAFPMDYPNILDRRHGRNGSSIWLHGTDKDLKPLDSNGCIALENGSLEKLEPLISLDRTPIIVSETVDFTPRQDRDQVIAGIDALVEHWKTAICQGDYHDYLAFYDSGYCPDISWWNEWRRIRDDRSHGASPFSLAVDQRGIYKDGDVVVVAFRLNLARGGRHIDMGLRKLYLTGSNGAYRIIGDTYKKNKTSELGHDEEIDNGNRIITAAGFILDGESKDRVAQVKKSAKQFVQDWVSAWSKGDMDSYAACYADTFRSDGMDKKAWVDRKRYLSSVYDYIRVTISDPVITVSGDRIYADFRQDYQSSGYRAAGHKTLELVNEERTWKILQEIWKKN